MLCGNDPRVQWTDGDRKVIEEFRQYLKESKEMTTRAPKSVEPTPEFIEGADVSESPEGWEWETVAEGAPLRIIFDTIGDVFIGQYIGEEHIDQEPAADGSDQSFDLFNFRGRDGEKYAINKSYALAEAMQKVNPGDWCRITYIKDVKTSRKLNDMKDFKVDVKR